MISKLRLKLKIPLIFTGLIFLSYLLVNYNKPQTGEPFFPAGKNSAVEQKSQIKKIDEETIAKISSIINTNLADANGQYAVFVKDLKTNQTIEFAANNSFTAASIYKLAVMYKTFDALEKGETTKNGVLISSTKSGNSPASHTIEEALRLMITISDNDSALALAEKFGWSNIEKFLIKQGISNFTLSGPGLPQTTAASTAQILERIYNGQAVSQGASQEMKKLLLSQTKNDRIPKYLPKNIKVAHKTGELDTVRHDAGIVYGKRSDYIFVFLSDTDDTIDASEKIANLSKQIFTELEDR